MNLTLVKKDGLYGVDSRQVAQQLGKEHAHLCRDIEGYVNDMLVGQNSEVSLDGQNPKLDSDGQTPSLGNDYQTSKLRADDF